jgi:membrane protease YdiL (CAAX protease family)
MFPKNPLQFLLAFFISIVCSTPLLPLLMDEKGNHNLMMMLFFISTLSIFIGIVHFINYKRNISIDYNIKPFNGKLCFFYILIIWIIETIIFRPIHFCFFSKSQSYDFYYLLGALIVAPVLEEIVFRNILLNSLLNNYRKKISIIISSLVFGLIHGSPFQIIFTTVIGLFLGIIYAKEKNIAYAIIVHFFANLFVVVSQVYSQNISNISFFYIICVNILVSFSLLFMIYKKYGYSIIKTIKQK